MHVFDLLFPTYCLNCKKLGNYICQDCQNLIIRHQQLCLVCNYHSPFGKTHPECQKHSYLDGIIIATEYKTLTKHSLYQIKHNLKYAILTELLNKTLLSPKIQICLIVEHFTLVTEVPMHPTKQKRQGFNQSTLIAQWIEKNYAIKHQPTLQKTQQTIPQKELNRFDRLFNLVGVFKPINKQLIQHQSILIVDDVTTTGSTLEECAKILKQHQAKKVWGLVIASGR